MKLFKQKEKYEPVAGLVGEATDYHVYEESLRERAVWYAVGFVVSGIVAFVFYNNWIISAVVGLICGYFFIGIRRKQVIEKRKEQLKLQFRSLLDALATSIGAGRNVFDSFNGAAQDLKVQYSEDADIVQEVNIICSGMDHNFQVEDLLLNFAERSGLEDVRNFANVFATCYQKGGNIREVIRNTATIIGDKIEVQMEVATMVSGQKSSQNIMLVMPVVFVAIMRSMGGDLVDLSSPVGIISVSIAIVIFVASYFVGKKVMDVKL